MDRRETLKAIVALLVGIIASRRPPAALTATAASADPAALAPVNLFEYEPLARRRLSQMAYDYIAGGAADEITLRRNRESFGPCSGPGDEESDEREKVIVRSNGVVTYVDGCRRGSRTSVKS